MERLVYNKNTQKLLEELAENSTCYWRYQDSSHGGVIPVNHISHERMYSGESPDYIEDGCSCYDNPYQLLEYMSNEYLEEDNIDIVIFCGEHKGYGYDEEDIVQVTEKEDILYSLNLKDFYEFCKNADMYFFGDKNLKEYAIEICGL